MRSFLKVAGVLAALFVLAVGLFHDKKSDSRYDTGEALEMYFMYGRGETQQAWFAGAVERFKEVHPGIEIKAWYPGRELLGKVRPRLLMGNPPDLFNGGDNELRPLRDGGLLEPLNEYLDEKAYDRDVPWREIFLPGILETYSDNGVVDMMPHGLFAYVFFYNIDQFEQHGLEEPGTWKEFLEVCRVLKENGIEPIAADGSVSGYNTLWYEYLVKRTTTPEHVLDTARGLPGTSWREDCYLEAARMLRHLTDSGYVMDGYQGSKWPSAQMRWVQGECAMLLNGTWIPKEMKAKMPEGFRMGFFTFPIIEGLTPPDAVPLTMGVEAYAIPKDSRHKREAVEFLKFITSEDEVRRLIDIDVATSIRGVGMPSALEGFEEALLPPTRIVKALGSFEPEWVRSIADANWSYFFLGNHEPEEFCRIVDEATRKYYELKRKEEGE